ncbi:unnamed protein product, partial [Closterium sp. Yama58-4]
MLGRERPFPSLPLLWPSSPLRRHLDEVDPVPFRPNQAAPTSPWVRAQPSSLTVRLRSNEESACSVIMAASTQETAPHSRTLDYGRSSSMIRRKAAAKGDLAKLIWCFIGVVGTLIIYGIGQERIMKFPYGDRDEDSEYFQHSLFIVLCNRLMTCAVAVIVHLVTGASLALVAPIYAYGAVSLSNVISSGCQYEIWGTLISRKQYKPREYIIAITIILGSCLFFLNVTARTSVKSTFSGLLLMLGYLGFDGFTNTFQDKLFEGYDMPAANQVLYITLCSSVISLL